MKASPPISTVRLVEEDVVLRLGLGEYLRACGFKAIEAAGLREAQLALRKGPPVHVLLAGAQLEGDGAIFARSKWMRLNRPQISVAPTGGLISKTQAAAKLCEDRTSAPCAMNELKQRIEGMRPQRKASAVKSKRSRRARPNGPDAEPDRVLALVLWPQRFFGLGVFLEPRIRLDAIARF